MHPPVRHPGRALLMLVVVERLPETNPNIEQAQAAAKATEKTVGDHGTQSGEREQEVIIGPLRSPRKNDEQDTSNGTHQNKKKNRGAMHPDLQSAGTWVSCGLVGRVKKRRAGIILGRSGLRCFAGAPGKGSWVRHR